MANGDLLERFKLLRTYLLIDDATATTDGVWIDAGLFEGALIGAEGTFVATVQVHGSNDATKPANTAHGFQIGADITTAVSATLDVLPRWLKARVSAFTSGTVKVTAALRGTK